MGPKTLKGERLVPVGADLRRFLIAHKLRSGRDGGDFLFGRSAPLPFTPSAVRRRALKAWAAASVGAFLRGERGELEPFGLHEGRHTYVSIMAAAGTPLHEVGDFVGHSSAYMVDRYRHLFDGQRVRAAERMDAFLSSSAEWRANPGQRTCL